MNKKKTRPSPSKQVNRPADQVEATGVGPAAPDTVVELDRAIRTERTIRRANAILEGEADRPAGRSRARRLRSCRSPGNP